MERTYKTSQGCWTDDRRMSDFPAPPFDTKIALVVRDDLATWQRLNVTAFLSSGITAAHPQLVGLPYLDADGTSYLPLIGMPVLVFEGDREMLRTVRDRAVRRSLPVALYTGDMFRTGHDEANRSVVRPVTGADLDVVGLAVFGPKNAVDRTVKGADLHP